MPKLVFASEQPSENVPLYSMPLMLKRTITREDKGVSIIIIISSSNSSSYQEVKECHRVAPAYIFSRVTAT